MKRESKDDCKEPVMVWELPRYKRSKESGLERSEGPEEDDVAEVIHINKRFIKQALKRFERYRLRGW